MYYMSVGIIVTVFVTVQYLYVLHVCWYYCYCICYSPIFVCITCLLVLLLRYLLQSNICMLSVGIIDLFYIQVVVNN